MLVLGAARTRLEVSRSLCWISGAARVEPETNNRFSRHEVEALTSYKPQLLKQFVKQYYKLFQQFACKESWYNNEACFRSQVSSHLSPLNINPCCIHLHKKLKPEEVIQGRYVNTFYSRVKICLRKTSIQFPKLSIKKCLELSDVSSGSKKTQYC